jgi:hypothetical protein
MERIDLANLKVSGTLSGVAIGARTGGVTRAGASYLTIGLSTAIPQPVRAESDEDVKEGIPFDPPAPIRAQMVAAVRRQLAHGQGSSFLTTEAVEALLEQLTALHIGEPLLLTPHLCGYLVVVLGRHLTRNVGRIDSDAADELRGLVGYLRDHTPGWIRSAMEAETPPGIQADLCP